MTNSTPVWIVAMCLLASACSQEHAPKATPPVDGRQPASVDPVVSPRQPAAAAPGSAVVPIRDKKCVVLLHGKGGRAQTSVVAGDITYLWPGGNAEGWGGREWRYFPEDGYQQVRASVASAIDQADCGQVIVQGFSNGAAAAAKLYCRGERFDDRVKGYIVDDPVPDHGVDGCRPGTGIRLRLYSTGALAMATDGWSCEPRDWTCEGGRTIGIANYARALGTEIAPSIHTTHTEYASPPEQTEWLARPE